MAGVRGAVRAIHVAPARSRADFAAAYAATLAVVFLVTCLTGCGRAAEAPAMPYSDGFWESADGSWRIVLTSEPNSAELHLQDRRGSASCATDPREPVDRTASWWVGSAADAEVQEIWFHDEASNERFKFDLARDGDFRTILVYPCGYDGSAVALVFGGQ